MPHPRREGAELLVVIRRPNTGPADSPAPRKKCSSRAESADIQNRLGVAAPRCVVRRARPCRPGTVRRCPRTGSPSSRSPTPFRGSDRRGSRRPRPSIRQMAGEASRTRRAVVGGEDDAATASTTTPAPASRSRSRATPVRGSRAPRLARSRAGRWNLCALPALYRRRIRTGRAYPSPGRR